MKNIIEFIENNSVEIIENIDHESVEVYNFLRQQYNNSNVKYNYLFQFVYRSFYRLDNAGLTPEFKTEYFNILEEFRNEKIFDFENILKRLHRYPNRKGQNTLQFSFTTKMLNTIDNKMPIYDSEVIETFSISRPPQNKTFDKKIEMYLNQLGMIQKSYHEIINKKLIPKANNAFDSKFRNSDLEEMKKLDFIFWSTGKVKKRHASNVLKEEFYFSE